MSVSGALLGITIASAVAYALFVSVLFLTQKNIIFPTPPKNLLLYEKFKAFSITLNNNNLQMQGWKISGASPNSDIVAIYFGGNGEDVAATIPSLEKLPASIVYAFNYRGYGLSSGTPSEAALYDDALRIFELVKNNHPKNKIAIIGYSLGSAVAGYLASRTDAVLLVLLAPLYSVERIAKENFSTLIPSAIIKNKFKLSEHVKNVKAKTLVIGAEKDTVIDNTHSRDTYTNLPHRKKIFFIKNVGHNDLFTQQVTFNLMAEFFAEH